MPLEGFQGDPTCLHWNEWDLANLKAAIARTRGRSVAVQAGGNLGVFASELAAQFDAVYTFEPSPKLFPLLVTNAPQENIIRFQAALGDEHNLISVALPEGDVHDGEQHVSGAGIIPTLRLDDLNLPVCDLLYLDIEGFELFALRGAAETIKRCRPVIALEINKCCERYGYGKRDLFELMKAWGYTRAAQVHSDHIFIPEERVSANVLNLVAVRTGDRYGPDYVPILFNMLLRNLTTCERDIALWCISDNPDELPEGIGYIPADPNYPGYWQKIRLFSPDMPWKEGERVAYFDLDVAITGSLEELVETTGIIQDEMWPCYNSSVMVWNAGNHARIWDEFHLDLIDLPARLIPHGCLPQGTVNGGDQEVVTELSRWATLPKPWCPSYKLHATEWPPMDAKVVIFNGQPKPHECSGWVKDVWKVGGMTSLPKMEGANVSDDVIWTNIEANAKRDLPWFRGAHPHAKTAVLVCGGPSLAENYAEIAAHKRRGARIFTVNNTLKVMLERGITPDAHILLDARPENIAFVPPADTRYFLASQCDLGLFEALKDHEVTVWHPASGNDERLESLCNPYEDDDKLRYLSPIPGGGTVGLRAMFLLFFSGYRKLHIYGMDGSYDGDRHHAFAQPLNDGETILDVVLNDKPYRCSHWMARQATEFEATYIELARFGMSIWVHGRGIIPDMAALLRAQMKAAA